MFIEVVFFLREYGEGSCLVVWFWVVVIVCNFRGEEVGY